MREGSGKARDYLDGMVTRRQFLLAALGGSVGLTQSWPPPTLAATGASLPSPVPWRPHVGDVDPAVKLQAARLVEAVGNWGRPGAMRTGAGDLAAAHARAAAAGFDPALVAALASLLGSGTRQVVRVRMAQYGGILERAASVLVVVDSWRANADGTVSAGGITLDVRLVRATPRWQVVDVRPARPLPALARPSKLAEHVISDDRIRLPHSARADVLGGGVHGSVLRLLRDLSRAHIVDVSVLRSGHPIHVFGTDRLSDHPRGRAVDVWALDGKPLALPANHGLAAEGMRFAVAHGAYNVGGPMLLPGSRFFSDRTHQDHIHLGFAV